MNHPLIQKTEAFLRETFQRSPLLSAHPDQLAYRLEHSCRVAGLGLRIARAEGFDPAEMAVACLLHDIAYARELATPQQRRDHGRLSAAMARPFLAELGLPRDRQEDILFGIAIHVDNEAGFPGTHTPFAETVSDADNIDRFGPLRLHEELIWSGFLAKPLEERRALAERRLLDLDRLGEMKLATPTAQALWRDRLAGRRAFYGALLEQLKESDGVSF